VSDRCVSRRSPMVTTQLVCPGFYGVAPNPGRFSPSDGVESTSCGRGRRIGVDLAACCGSCWRLSA
jgi:hypothetical protein